MSFAGFAQTAINFIKQNNVLPSKSLLFEQKKSLKRKTNLQVQDLNIKVNTPQELRILKDQHAKRANYNRNVNITVFSLIILLVIVALLYII